MLTDLIIRNFAIIDRLHVRFGAGFNVLTGETGAGKSIIIDAVNLLLGGRARAELIRTGEEEATVEALFDLTGEESLRRDLAEGGIEADGELLIKRVVTRGGKNRLFINGSLSTLGQLQDYASRLVSIYGQHEHQGLQRSENHLALLDRFAALEPAMEAYRLIYEEVEALSARLRRLDEADRDRQKRLDLLSFQAREIAAASLRPGEDQELEAERALLLNAERLTAATAGGYETLYGQEGALCEQLDRVAGALEALSTVDPELGRLGEAARSALYSLEDIAVQLRDYAGKISFEPGRQDEVEKRLHRLTDLKRKYAPTLEEILQVQARAEEELAELGDVEAAREGLSRELAGARQRLDSAGAELSRLRREGAARMRRAVEEELQQLAMGRVHFEMRLFPLEAPGLRGLERGEFFISPNPGEEPRPLARIASGGELSRIMLALKRSAPDGDGVRTLIFDEVDAGIGGAAATAVGEKLQAVSRERQVLCITHLPQVAAFADLQYRVEKHEEAGRTFTTLTPLEADQRVQEMARMLGGARVTERTLEHAREIIAQSAPR